MRGRTALRWLQRVLPLVVVGLLGMLAMLHFMHFNMQSLRRSVEGNWAQQQHQRAVVRCQLSTACLLFAVPRRPCTSGWLLGMRCAETQHWARRLPALSFRPCAFGPAAARLLPPSVQQRPGKTTAASLCSAFPSSAWRHPAPPSRHNSLNSAHTCVPPTASLHQSRPFPAHLQTSRATNAALLIAVSVVLQCTPLTPLPSQPPTPPHHQNVRGVAQPDATLGPTPPRLEIILFAYNRPASFERLWSSLEAAEESDPSQLQTELVVHMDYDPSHSPAWQKQKAMLEQLQQRRHKHGPLKIVFSTTHKSLRGALSEGWAPAHNSFAMFLEDDVRVAPLVLRYAQRVISAYSNQAADQTGLLGFQLYNQQFDETNQQPLPPPSNGHAPFRTMEPCFWATIFRPQPFADFLSWFSTHSHIDPLVPHSWTNVWHVCCRGHCPSSRPESQSHRVAST